VIFFDVVMLPSLLTNLAVLLARNHKKITKVL
jgi:hypothetical protein